MAATTLPEFNPTQNQHVAIIKTKTEELLNYVGSIPKHEADQVRVTIALTNYEQAAMWAVKALFAK